MQVYFKTAYPESENLATPLAEIDESYGWRTVFYTVIGVGILLRLFHFIDNRSLFIDEIFLSSSLIRMNFTELLAPYLDYEQKAPIGFLWLVRACVLLFGKNEMALRLISLLSGIGSLFLFLPVARYFLKPLGVVVALGILAMAPPLVYHAVEIKQYSTELFATIVAIYLYIRFQQKRDLRSLLLWGISGAAIIWFSYTSIFILAGMAIGSGLYYLFKKDWPILFRSLIPFTLWLVSFAVNFLLFTGKHANSDWLTFWFKNHEAFMPFPPTTASDLKWFIQTPYKVMHYPLGLLWFSPAINFHPMLRIVLRMTLLPLLLLVVGLYQYFKHDKKLFLVMVLPIALHLVASGLEKYPFFDRLTVYLSPWLILFIARGCEQVSGLLPVQPRFWRFVLPALLLVGPLVNSVRQVADTGLFGDYKKSYQREALLYINDHIQPGDAVYIYWNGLPSYDFYKNIYPLKYQAIPGQDLRLASTSLEDYFRNLSTDFNKFAGKKRVWLLYNKHYTVKIGDIYHQPAWYYQNEAETQKSLERKFAVMGKEVDSYDAFDVKVILYDLTAKN